MIKTARISDGRVSTTFKLKKWCLTGINPQKYPFILVSGRTSPASGEYSPYFIRLPYPTSVRISFNLWRSAIPTAAASITRRLSSDLTVTLAMPLTVIFPNPNSSFARLFTRSTAVRIRYNLAHFLVSLGTGTCLSLIHI